MPVLSSPDDPARPLFAYGLLKPGELAFSLVERYVSRRSPARAGGRLWIRDGLQAAYLLLWSIIERYTALRFGPGLSPTDRVRRLGEDDSFRAAVAAAGATEGMVIDSRSPGTRYRLRTDGTGAALYYYQVRSNLSHRGKSAFSDAQLVHKSVTELAKAMNILLEWQMPALPGE